MKQVQNKDKYLDILYICNSLDLGGAERIMYEIVKDFKCYKKEIVCLTKPGYYSALIEKEGIKITYCYLKKNLFDFFKIFKIYLLLLNN